MTRIGFTGRMLMLALLGLLFAVAAATPALAADKVHLKDGRVLEGSIEREVNGNVWFLRKIGSLEHREFFTADQIARIERDTAPKEPAKPANRRAASNASGKDSGSATRVAVLNFGPPSSWQGAVEDMVGAQIYAKAWEDAIPLLERDNIDVVVVRINSGGGYVSEVPKFHKLYEEMYKPRFRTVAWVESAISAAAMSPYVIEEFYFMPEGNMGACTAWSGNLTAAKDLPLEVYLSLMEDASRKGKRDFRIMRAMQIEAGLSANIDPETGEVTWQQDTNGEYVVNGGDRVLTFNSRDAERFRFSLGTAATIDELCAAMGLTEWVVAGQQASELIDKSMRDADRTDKKLREVMNKYAMAVQAAQQVQDRQLRGAEVSRARRFLNELRNMIRVNPNFEDIHGLDADWFERQERMLRELMR